MCCAVLSLSVLSDSLWPHGPQHPGFQSPTISQSLLRLMSFESVMSSNHLILCGPLLLPSIFPASGSFPITWLFTSGDWGTGASASASVFPVNTQGWFPLGMRFDLLAIQGTLKSPLQHHSSKASILWHSAFFTVQLSHPYKTTGNTIAFTRWTFVDKVMFLLFNTLSRFVMAFFFQGASIF